MINEYLRQLDDGLAVLEGDARGQLMRLSEAALLTSPHGDLPRWLAAVSALPDVQARWQVDRGAVSLVAAANTLDADPEQTAATLQQLHPWRKGPFSVLGVDIDTEWRSDWKWQRVLPHISELSGRHVLDVGCGSGYHLWRMREAGASLVLGIDPGMLFLCQFLALKRYLPEEPVFLVPARMEDLGQAVSGFDTVFSMGVLYHRRSPLDHLLELFQALRPGGELVLETLVVPGQGSELLMPAERYAQMRNVFFLPSVPLLETFISRCGFTDIRAVDVTATTTDEQRSTAWMRFQSLADFLDPSDRTRTVEGYPAPLRATVVARRPA